MPDDRNGTFWQWVKENYTPDESAFILDPQRVSKATFKKVWDYYVAYVRTPSVGEELEAAFPDLPPEALTWLSEHPESIQWPTQTPTISQATSRAFWAWAETMYSPEELESIRNKPSKYLQFYQHDIQDTRWDVGEKAAYQDYRNQGGSLSYEGWVEARRPLVMGSETPEAFGVTSADWQRLTGLMRDDVGLKSQLQEWISAGRIDQGQAADIWDELREQRMRESRARVSAQQRTDFMLAATGGLEAPEDRTRRLAERDRLKEEARIRGEYVSMSRAGLLGAPRPAAPFTDYGAGLEDLRTGLSETMPKTEQWRDWFRSKYPRLIERFEAKPEAERTKATWAEYLKKRKPEIREEFARLTPFQRGERPSAFQPRIQTVGF